MPQADNISAFPISFTNEVFAIQATDNTSSTSSDGYLSWGNSNADDVLYNILCYSNNRRTWQYNFIALGY